MNIKKFIVLSCMTFILTGFIDANQAAYNAAFIAFAQDPSINRAGGISTLAQAVNFIANDAGVETYTLAQSVANKLNTPQAMAVGLYISSGNPITLKTKFPNADVVTEGTTVSFSNLQAALTAAMNGTGGSSTSTTPATTPSTGTTNSTTTTTPTTTAITNSTTTTTPTTTPTTTAITTDQAAAALKTQIDSSVATYNSYLQSVNQSQVKIVAA